MDWEARRGSFHALPICQLQTPQKKPTLLAQKQAESVKKHANTANENHRHPELQFSFNGLSKWPLSFSPKKENSLISRLVYSL